MTVVPSYSTSATSETFMVVGGSDGRIYFFKEGSPDPFCDADALPESIIAIEHAPFFCQSQPFLVVVGINGSWCLFKRTTLHQLFTGGHLPIQQVFTVTQQQLIITGDGHDDYIVYSIKENHIVQIIVSPPINAMLLWSKNAISHPGSFASPCTVRYGTRSIVYQTYEIAQFSQCLKIGHNSVDKNVTQFQALLSNSDDSTSFLVLIGSEGRPTFLYAPYLVNGSSVYQASPFIAAVHYVSRKKEV